MTTIPKRRYEVNLGDGATYPQFSFSRHVYMKGESGQGKTSTAMLIMAPAIERGSPAAIIDDVGALAGELEAKAVASCLRTEEALVRRRRFTPQQIHTILERKFFSRYTFARVGSLFPHDVTIGLLTRRKLPNGKLEPIADTVSGFVKILASMFPGDIGQRTRLLTNAEMCFAMLVAAKRTDPGEIFRILEDPHFWPFLMTEYEKHCPESQKHYTEPLKMRLREMLDMRFSSIGEKGNKVRGEFSPFPERYRAHVESTMNACRVFRSSHPISTFFSGDSFNLEAVPFGQGVFSLTNTLGTDLERGYLNAITYTIFERLARHRVPNTPYGKYRLLFGIDEGLRWMNEEHIKFFDVARNHRVSILFMHQFHDQWKARGLEGYETGVKSVLRMHIEWRAETNHEAMERASILDPYDPWAFPHEFTTTNTTKSASETESESESEGDGEGESDSHSTTDGTTWGDVDVVSYRYDEDGVPQVTNGTNTSHGRTDAVTSGSSRSRNSFSSRARGAAKTNGTSEGVTLHRQYLSVQDQAFLRAQELRTLDEHTAQITVVTNRKKFRSKLAAMRPYDGPNVPEKDKERYRLEMRRRHARFRRPAKAYLVDFAPGIPRAARKSLKKTINAFDGKEKG